ncbi:MAG TPA: adenylate/guanylate cyclase domain-containing protein [Candidatus Cybelea sp.]|nr:adenylate/guanylate cyclase domain-containing protein [Candidatus Cybelea sp.]
MAEESVQRRLAAVLAADVAGYSRLMGADEEGTLARLRSIRRELVDPGIDAHRGRIVKTTGDGLLVEFASVVDALRCAVAMQQALNARNAPVDPDRRIVFRIGINVGDIMVEAGDIFGDGVNVAARLQAMAEPGGICVSARVRDDARGKIGLDFEDLGEQRLKNIAWPVRVFRALLGTGTPGAARPAAATADQLSLAVLPFLNMSGDPEQTYFAEGLAEDLITDLSKVAGFLVIARNSSFAYKGRSVDVRAIAAELGVRYVIEGSVRRAATRVRINAQLIDAATGNHIWAERYDRDLADIFVVQDEVVSEIVRALAGRLAAAQVLPRRRTTSLEAYELFVNGRMLTAISPEDNKRARPLLEKAIELDPEFAEAHAWLAMSHHFGWIYLGESEEHSRLARTSAEKAVSLDPDNPDAHIVLGYVWAYEDDLAAGVAEFEKGLRINPNHAAGWSLLGDLRTLEGRPLEGMDCVRKAFRLNPHPWGDYYWLLGWCQYAARQYQDAVETLSHESARGPGVGRILAAALAQLGRMPEARVQADQFLRQYPDFSAQRWGRKQPFRNEADRRHFIEGYVKAGLPG